MAEAGSSYKVSVPWSEVGAHSVAVMLHGAHVAGSPFIVQAITQVNLLQPLPVCCAKSNRRFHKTG